jgi:dephospho-CoA kinase
MAECTPESGRPFVIGLTGNIATGKSLVAEMLSRRGATHLDADRLAHRVMSRGTPAWERIVGLFGLDVLKPNGAIDRGKLGAIVFSDPAALARLEEIVHPDVVVYTRQSIATAQTAVVVVEAIKLIESGMVEQLCDRVWVITAPRCLQIQRLTQERGLSHAEAVLRVDAQSSQEAKVARADVVIDNSGTPRDTERQVDLAWESSFPMERAQGSLGQR